MKNAFDESWNPELSYKAFIYMSAYSKNIPVSTYYNCILYEINVHVQTDEKFSTDERPLPHVTHTTREYYEKQCKIHFNNEL